MMMTGICAVLSFHFLQFLTWHIEKNNCIKLHPLLCRIENRKISTHHICWLSHTCTPDFPPTSQFNQILPPPYPSTSHHLLRPHHRRAHGKFFSNGYDIDRAQNNNSRMILIDDRLRSVVSELLASHANRRHQSRLSCRLHPRISFQLSLCCPYLYLSQVSIYKPFEFMIFLIVTCIFFTCILTVWWKAQPKKIYKIPFSFQFLRVRIWRWFIFYSICWPFSSSSFFSIMDTKTWGTLWF
jgi:hypothetical protein